MSTAPQERPAVAILYPTNIHCADCVRDMIDGVLRDKQGVVDASFDADAGSLSVTYRPELVDEEAIRAAIADLGYGFAAGPDAKGSPSGWSNILIVVGIVVALVVAIVLLRAVLGG